ncbi:YceI family protein [Streptomyces sp. NPDC001985]|uniref:YceI family protein n=1 Tax=Streptomyces sp. NPDC001985 TaxID=3154406 RepID=UPI00332B042D
MTASGVERQSVPVPGTYEIDTAASSLRFETRAFWLLPVVGTLTIGHGSITVSESVEESSVDVVIPSGSFDSANAKRDEHVKSAEYLDTAAYPEMTFRGRSLDRSGGGGTLRGQLTVHGVTRPVAIAVDSVSFADGRLTARGTTTVDRYAFGVTRSKGFTSRHLTISVTISARL